MEMDNQQGASGLTNNQMPDHTVLYCEFPESVLGADAEDIKHPIKLKLLGHIPIEQDIEDLEQSEMMESLRRIYEQPGSLKLAQEPTELFFLPLRDSDLVLTPPSPVNKKNREHLSSTRNNKSKKKKKKKKKIKDSPESPSPDKVDSKCSYCGNPGPMWDNDQKLCICCAGTFANVSCDDEGKKKCSLCPAAYYKAAYLFRHVKMKHQDVLYSCAYCDKRVRDRTTLKYHMRIHTGEKPFGCQTCGMHFSYRGNMMRHKYTVHERISPHPCNLCEKRFSHPHLLRLHQRVHFDEKPYQCADCPKGFRTRSDMVRHTSVHMDLRPHVCNLCGNKFKTRGQLNNHLMIHKAEKADFKCKECGNMFTKTGIIQHFKTAH